MNLSDDLMVKDRTVEERTFVSKKHPGIQGTIKRQCVDGKWTGYKYQARAGATHVSVNSWEEMQQLREVVDALQEMTLSYPDFNASPKKEVEG